MSKQPPKSIKVTALRANLYKLLDEIIETGKPLIVERNGVNLVISQENPPTKLERLMAAETKAPPSAYTDDELIYHGMGEYKMDGTLAEYYGIDE